MGERGRGLGRALGNLEARQRRHRKVAIATVLLLLVAGALIFVFGEDDVPSGLVAQASAVCDTYTERLQHEFELTFPDGVPTPAAEAEYLSHAFVDTLDDLVDELQALSPTGAAADAVDTLAATSAALRADPSLGSGVDPLAAEVRPAFDDAGIEACGSGFLAAPE